MNGCPKCRIGLPEDVNRCPLCRRWVNVSSAARRFGFYALVIAPVAVVLLVAAASPSLEATLLWHRTSPKDAYRAALAYLQNTPDLRGAVRFSGADESVIERWGPMRFRISGAVELQSHGHNTYSCVLTYQGADRWEVEDLHIERLQ